MSKYFNIAQFVIRIVPNGMRGKARFGRILLRCFSKQNLLDSSGLIFEVPSLHEPIAHGIFTFGSYERSTIEMIIKHLPEHGVFIDVGANIGSISIPVAAIRPDASVIAIEADPQIAEYLRSNVSNNKLTNITVIESLVGSMDKNQVPFNRAPNEKFGMGSVGTKFDTEAIFLRQMTLLRILHEAGEVSPDVLKVDVEGAEYGVFKGAAQLLEGDASPVIIFEFCDWSEQSIVDQSPGDAQKFLIDLGYHMEMLGKNISYQSTKWPLKVGSAMIYASKKLDV